MSLVKESMAIKYSLNSRRNLVLWLHPVLREKGPRKSSCVENEFLSFLSFSFLFRQERKQLQPSSGALSSGLPFVLQSRPFLEFIFPLTREQRKKKQFLWQNFPSSLVHFSSRSCEGNEERAKDSSCHFFVLFCTEWSTHSSSFYTERERPVGEWVVPWF